MLAWWGVDAQIGIPPREGHDAVLLRPSDGAKNAFSHRRNGSEARSLDFSGLRMRDNQFLYSILAVFLNVGRMFFYLDMGAARSGRLSRGVGPPGLKTWKAGPGTLDGDPRRCTPRGT